MTGKTKLIVVAGNHDVGFHYDMIERKIDRFNRSFQGQLVQLYQPEERNDVNFLVVNSMALQNDECKFCKKAQKQLKHLNKTLQCLKYKTDSNYSQLNKYCKFRQNSTHLHKRNYSRPIVFTHFPLYRKSDQICPQDVDSEAIVQKVEFKQNFDCLSKDSTEQAYFFILFYMFKSIKVNIFNFLKAYQTGQPSTCLQRTHSLFLC